MVVTDLDGTLLNNDRMISQQDLETLHSLRHQGVLRVIATGRNLYSARKVLSDDTPIDYLIFSSGAGIMNWSTKELIYQDHIPEKIVSDLIALFIDHKYDFMVHQPVPDNHHFYYWRSKKGNKDFERRLSVYRTYGKMLEPYKYSRTSASQLLVITRQPDHILPKLQNELTHLNVIRTTSPLDGKTTWIEIFPKHVSKAYASQWLLKHLDYKPRFTLAIGNDYNDSALLDWAEYSFVVANAAPELKSQYNNSASNSDHGFTEAVEKVRNKVNLI